MSIDYIYFHQVNKSLDSNLFHILALYIIVAIAILKKKAVVEGTEEGLANMIKMCEEAARSQHVIMN